MINYIFNKWFKGHKQRLDECAARLNKLQQEINQLTDQKILAQKDLESVKRLLTVFTTEYLKCKYDYHYDNNIDIPVLGALTRNIDNYLWKMELEAQIKWARANGSKKQEVRFHGGCNGCKSPTEVGVYRCLGCKYLMGVTSNYPDLSFK